MLHELWRELGAVRLLGRFTELSIIAGLCDKVPFGAIILIPLLVTFTTGYLLRGLLHDVGLDAPVAGNRCGTLVSPAARHRSRIVACRPARSARIGAGSSSVAHLRRAATWRRVR